MTTNRVLTVREYALTKDKYRKRGIDIAPLWDTHKLHGVHINSIGEYLVRSDLPINDVKREVYFYMLDINYFDDYSFIPVSQGVYRVEVSVPDIRLKRPRTLSKDPSFTKLIEAAY